jgi:hypothetical protein
MTAKRPFDEFDFEGFWNDHPYSLENYVEPSPSDELIASIEEELGGYRLPAAYVDLARRHNGGLFKRNCHPTKERTGWAEDHVAITGLYAIGRTSKYSLAAQLGAKFMIEEMGLPADRSRHRRHADRRPRTDYARLPLLWETRRTAGRVRRPGG